MQRALSAILVMLVLACGGNQKPKTPSVRPPQMLGNRRPEYKFPTNVRNGTALDMRVEVMVDPGGRAVMSTFKLIGAGAPDNEPIVREWIAAASFRPGTQAGTPVMALYQDRLKVEVRTTVQRVR